MASARTASSRRDRLGEIARRSVRVPGQKVVAIDTGRRPMSWSRSSGFVRSSVACRSSVGCRRSGARDVICVGASAPSGFGSRWWFVCDPSTTTWWVRRGAVPESSSYVRRSMRAGSPRSPSATVQAVHRGRRVGVYRVASVSTVSRRCLRFRVSVYRVASVSLVRRRSVWPVVCDGRCVQGCRPLRRGSRGRRVTDVSVVMPPLYGSQSHP